MTLAQQVCQYYQDYIVENLPQVQLLYPLKNPAALTAFRKFYWRFYSSGPRRCLIFGINPRRLGAGITGVQFADTIRLQEDCGIAWTLPHNCEPSSTFVYSVIEEYGKRRTLKMTEKLEAK